MLETLRAFESSGGRVITLRSRREVAAFLRGIGGTAAMRVAGEPIAGRPKLSGVP